MVFNSSMLMAGATANASGYSITNSARFVRGNSCKLTRTPGGAGDRQKWTFSTWFKPGDLPTGTNETVLFSAGTGANDYDTVYFRGTEKVLEVQGVYASSVVHNCRTPGVFRDPSAWYHIIISVDTTNATAGDRIIIYVNGSRVTGLTNVTNIAQNTNTYVNSIVAHYIGAFLGGASYSDGYFANTTFINSTQTASAFGQTNTSGVWVPKAYSGTYGTNGFLMEFKNSAALGTDTSGNGNTFTSSGLVAGDQMTDTPTLNFATMDPLFPSSAPLTKGNLTSTTSASLQARSTIGFAYSGKFFATATIKGVTTGNIVGFISGRTLNSALYQSQSTGFVAYYAQTGQVLHNTTNTAGWTTSTTLNDVIGLQWDNGTFSAWKNGTLLGTKDASSYFASTDTIFFAFGTDTGAGGIIDWNFGTTAFAYEPAGAVKLNTTNLPAPAIKDGSAHFQTALHTGTGSALTINQTGNSTFTPDFVWTKGRSGATDHVLSNIISGTGKYLVSDTTAAEVTNAQALTAFGAGSISYGTMAAVNTNAATYVDWMWKGGGAGVSNISGSITSTVSVNTTAGFSIVKWTGTAANATVGHGLGVAPTFMILKPNAVTEWPVYHGSLANTEYIVLNTTAAKATGATYWNSTSPTSTVFSLGSSTNTNNSSGMVALVFTPIAGFSAFGSYTGNGSADGPFIYTGFTPAWLLIKRTDTTGNWRLIDRARDDYNGDTANVLYPDLASAEDIGGVHDDWLSNGFKPRQSAAPNNASGGTYIYAAFASNPFGGSGAAPATAR